LGQIILTLFNSYFNLPVSHLHSLTPKFITHTNFVQSTPKPWWSP
jgi:hypothetical protein